MIVTLHARQRYCERIDPRLTTDQAAAIMHGHAGAVDRAAQFGAKVVRLGNGAKLVLEGDIVVTVIPRGWIVRDLGAVS